MLNVKGLYWYFELASATRQSAFTNRGQCRASWVQRPRCRIFISESSLSLHCEEFQWLYQLSFTLLWRGWLLESHWIFYWIASWENIGRAKYSRKIRPLSQQKSILSQMESFSKRSILIEMQFESNCLWIQFYNKDQTARIYLKTKADWSRVLWTWQLSYERRERGESVALTLHIYGSESFMIWTKNVSNFSNFDDK